MINMHSNNGQAESDALKDVVFHEYFSLPQKQKKIIEELAEIDPSLKGLEKDAMLTNIETNLYPEGVVNDMSLFLDNALVIVAQAEDAWNPNHIPAFMFFFARELFEWSEMWNLLNLDPEEFSKMDFKMFVISTGDEENAKDSNILSYTQPGNTDFKFWCNVVQAPDADMDNLDSVLTQEMLFSKAQREVFGLDKTIEEKVDMLFERCMEEGIMPELFNPSNLSFKDRLLEFNKRKDQMLMDENNVGKDE